MKPLIVPTINLNGNTAEDLVKQLTNVLDHVRLLEEAMAKASDVVHGRNFQLSADPYGQRMAASDAWRERQSFLDKMDSEVTELAIAIQNQKREYRRGSD